MSLPLVPVEQKQVVFYEDTITAVLVLQEQERRVYVPIRPLCELLGLSWSGQRQRIQRDPVLSEVASSVYVTLSSDTQQDQEVEMVCLPLDYISGFLFGISANRVKPELKSRVIQYQKECYKVLHEAFAENRLRTDIDFEALLQDGSPESQAYHMIQAMLQLARNQVLLRHELDIHSTQLTDHEKRIEHLEETLGDPSRYVTAKQASQISQAVKAVAIAMSEKTSRNEFGGVYGELYRRFEITSYKQLPAKRFEEAMTFLTDWHQSVVGDTPF